MEHEKEAQRDSRTVFQVFEVTRHQPHNHKRKSSAKYGPWSIDSEGRTDITSEVLSRSDRFFDFGNQTAIYQSLDPGKLLCKEFL